MNIQEVSDILGVCHFLRAPQHVFITPESVYEQQDGRAFFRGLQPKSRGDTIFLSAQADITTVPHESWHAQTGLGETTAYPVGKIISLKYEFLKQFPRLKTLLTRKVEYKRVTKETEFPQASKYGSRVEHYVRV